MHYLNVVCLHDLYIHIPWWIIFKSVANFERKFFVFIFLQSRILSLRLSLAGWPISSLSGHLNNKNGLYLWGKIFSSSIDEQMPFCLLIFWLSITLFHFPDQFLWKLETADIFNFESGMTRFRKPLWAHSKSVTRCSLLTLKLASFFFFFF